MRKGGYACTTCGVKLRPAGRRVKGTPKGRLNYRCPQCDRGYSLPRPPTKAELMRFEDYGGPPSPPEPEVTE